MLGVKRWGQEEGQRKSMERERLAVSSLLCHGQMKREILQAYRNYTRKEFPWALPHFDPIILPLIVAMGTWNTATKRDQHEMKINLH